MKRYRFTLFSLLLLTHTATATENSHIEAVLDTYLKAWNTHNKVEITNAYAPHVAWYDLTSHKKIIGKENVAPTITRYFMDSVEDMYWHKSGDIYVSNNTIIYEWIYGGRYNGKWGDKIITNKVFSLNGINTTTINTHGKITAQKDYYDMESFKRAIGVKQ